MGENLGLRVENDKDLEGERGTWNEEKIKEEKQRSKIIIQQSYNN